MSLEEWVNRVHQGHVLTLLKRMPDDSVDLVITSPPYWGLRSYGKETEVDWADGWHGALGLEPTFQTYIMHLLEVFKEVKRVLKPTGAFYLNIGDCSSKTGAHTEDDRQALGKNYLVKADNTSQLRESRDVTGLPPKCLVNIPERLAIRMVDEQDWVERNKIIWRKPNHMPEPTQDNYTSSWEYIYFFVKQTEKTTLWRHRKTKQWVSEKPMQKYFDSKGEYDNYWWKCKGGYGKNGELQESCVLEGGDWKSRLRHVKTTKAKGLKHTVKGPRPLWLGFHYYFDLDAIRIPNKVVGVTDMRPPGVLRQKLYAGSRKRYGASGDPHLSQYQGTFEGFGEESEKYGSPSEKTQRHTKLTNEDYSLSMISPQKRVDMQGIPGGAAMSNPNGKNPGDVVGGAILGESGAVKVPGGKGWTGSWEGGGARIMRENDPRWLPPDGKNPGDSFEDPGDFWTLTTQGYKGAHFACFPLHICYNPILASCPPNGGIVLDPFAGSGTTAEAVNLLNIYGRIPTSEEIKETRTSKTPPLTPIAQRKWIMLELNPSYIELIRHRLESYMITQ